MYNIIRSLLIVAVVSSTVAGIFYLLDYSFINVFLITSVSQLILGFAVSTIRDAYININQKRLETEQIKHFARQGAELQCAFCNTRVFAPIRLDEDNEFKCPSCENLNSVYVNITVARSTHPLDANPLTTFSIVDEEEEIIKHIRSND